MRILLVNDYHVEGGGAESYFFELKKRLQQDASLSVFSLGFADLTTQGKDFYTLPAAKSKVAKLFWRFFLHPIYYFKLKKIIRQFKPDVIHLHNIKQYSCTILKLIKNYPVVQTVHDFSLLCPTAQNIHLDNRVCETGFNKTCFWQHQVKFSKLNFLLLTLAFFTIRKRLKKTVQHYIAPSPILADFLRKNNFLNVHCIPHFKKDKPVNLPGDVNQFLFAGVLEKHKGIYLLVDEFHLAYKKNANLILHIVGQGGAEMFLQEKIKILGLEKNIFLHGWQQSIDPFLSRCQTLIFPSIGMESFGLVVIEAMAASRAVIASNRSALPWLIDNGRSGLLFDPLAKGDLAEKILASVLSAPTMGKNGYERLHQLFDNNKNLTALLHIYKTTGKK